MFLSNMKTFSKKQQNITSVALLPLFSMAVAHSSVDGAKTLPPLEPDYSNPKSAPIKWMPRYSQRDAYERYAPCPRLLSASKLSASWILTFYQSTLAAKMFPVHCSIISNPMKSLIWKKNLDPNSRIMEALADGSMRMPFKEGLHFAICI